MFGVWGCFLGFIKKLIEFAGDGFSFKSQGVDFLFNQLGIGFAELVLQQKLTEVIFESLFRLQDIKQKRIDFVILILERLFQALYQYSY